MEQLLAGAQPACQWLLPVQREEAAASADGRKRRAVGDQIAREAVASGGGEGGAGPLRAAVALLLKGYLQNCQEVRELIGVCYYKWKLGLEDPVTKAVKAANSNYAAQAKANAEKEEAERADLGPPYIQTFAALVKGLYEDTRAPEKHRIVLYRWLNNFMATAQREDIEMWVKSCRIKDCWAKAGKKKDNPMVSLRLSLCFQASSKKFKASMDDAGEEITVEESLLASLKAVGAVRDVGPPPRGALEREAQKLLDKHFGEGANGSGDKKGGGKK